MPLCRPAAVGIRGAYAHSLHYETAPSMTNPEDDLHTLHTTDGDYALQEYRLGLAGRTWTILHTDAMLTHADEMRFFGEGRPYGVALWPAAIALAHELASRAGELRGTRVLELGAGTGLPGIVAASLGARVVQTDRQRVALAVCKRNAALNGIGAVTHRLADWTDWHDDERYDWIIGSDVLYGEVLHSHLRRIFERNLAPGGRVLLSDPFRAASLALLEALDADGWGVSLSKWSVGEEDAPRAIAVYALNPPR